MRFFRLTKEYSFKRRIENRRAEILANAQEVMRAFKEGTAKRGSVDDLIADCCLHLF